MSGSAELCLPLLFIRRCFFVWSVSLSHTQTQTHTALFLYLFTCSITLTLTHSFSSSDFTSPILRFPHDSKHWLMIFIELKFTINTVKCICTLKQTPDFPENLLKVINHRFCAQLSNGLGMKIGSGSVSMISHFETNYTLIVFNPVIKHSENTEHFTLIYLAKAFVNFYIPMCIFRCLIGTYSFATF